MKTLTLLIFGFLLFPMSLSAQSVDVLLQKVSEALSAGKDDYAVSLFRQAAGAGTEQTEMYYWTNVEKNSAVAPRFVRELAAYYKDKRNYDKAYLFYKEWLQYNPEDVSGLVACAEMQMMRGETKDALKITSCCSHMTAAAKIYCNLAYIHISIGTQGNFERLSFHFIDKHGNFHSRCKAKLTDDTVQILAIHTIELHVSFFKISDNTFSIQKQDTLCKNTPHYLILHISFLIERFVNDLTEIESCLHQFPGNTHGLR